MGLSYGYGPAVDMADGFALTRGAFEKEKGEIYFPYSKRSLLADCSQVLGQRYNEASQ